MILLAISLRDLDEKKRKKVKKNYWTYAKPSLTFSSRRVLLPILIKSLFQNYYRQLLMKI
jgi:hypothetical protein